MKSKNVFILMVGLFTVCSLLIHPRELDLLNLKGIKDIVFFLDVNGISYRQGYSHITDKKIKDFNMENVDKQLDSEKIPLEGMFIKELYQNGVKQLKESSIRIKEIYDGETSIIPFLVVSLEIKKITGGLYVILVQLILSERIWTHPGKEKKTEVYTWYKKKIGVTKSKKLKPAIQETVEQIISDFIEDCKKVKLKK